MIVGVFEEVGFEFWWFRVFSMVGFLDFKGLCVLDSGIIEMISIF